jgi:hypothetical protein
MTTNTQAASARQSSEGVFPVHFSNRVRLFSLETARAVLGVDTEAVMDRIESGALAAFDLSVSSSPLRRMLRISRLSLVPTPDPSPEAIIADALLTEPSLLGATFHLGSSKLEIAWSVTDDHLRHLAAELGGELDGRWRFSRPACAAFLRRRLVS